MKIVAMHEGHRMAYLEAMGIEMFVPRYVLPNAQASEECALPESGLPESNVSEVADVSVSVKGLSDQELAGNGLDANGSSVKTNNYENNAEHAGEVTLGKRSDNVGASILNRLDSHAKIDHSTAKTEPAVASLVDVLKQPEKDATLTFTLAIWHVNNFYIIDSHDPHAALPTHTLLNNLLTFGFGCDEKLPRAEMLHWPLFLGDGSDNSWQAASEMVFEFVNNRLLNLEASNIEFLLLGEDAVRLFLGGHVLGEHAGQENYWKNLTAADIADLGLSVSVDKVHVLPSLAQVLKKPLLKQKIQTYLWDKS